MLLKVLGSIIVLLSSSYLGYILSIDCKRRPQQLRELQSLLQMFENQISYLSDILSEAFDRVYRSSKSEVGIFFFSTLEKLKEDRNINAADAWEEAVKQNIKKTALKAEDEEILISFGKILGSSDLEGQIKNIHLTLSQLKMQEQKAEHIRAKNEKMYKNLGFLGGIAVVIILL